MSPLAVDDYTIHHNQHRPIPIRSQPRLCSSHVSNSTLPSPHRPNGRRLPNASLIWMAGGTAGGTFSDTGILPVALYATRSTAIQGTALG